MISGLDRVAAQRLKRPRPLDGNGQHAIMARGKSQYRLGSPNPAGTNQHNPNLMGTSMMNRFGPSNLDQLARLSAIKLRGY
jgi:hypothetical protein